MVTEPPRVDHVPGQLMVDDVLPPRILSLFSGYGGLDMAVREVLGGHVVAHAEHEPPTRERPRPSQAAARVLAERYPDVPNLGDVTAIDWRTLEPVDVVAAGFPCQDVSSAGLRAGIAPGTRSGLWAHVAVAVDQLRPALVVIENVRGLLSARAHHPAHSGMVTCPWCMDHGSTENLRALGAVLGDLADLGYDAAWEVVRAADVGAPHGRARVVCLAWPAAADPGSEAVRVGPGLWAGGPPRVGWGRPDDGSRETAPHAARAERGGQEQSHMGATGGRAAEPRECASGTVPDPDGNRREGLENTGPGRDAVREAHKSDADRRGDTDVPDTDGSGLAGAGGAGRPAPRRRAGADGGRSVAARRVPDVEWGRYGPAIRRWATVLGRPAPEPVVPGARDGQTLSPAFVEWLMGLPAGWVTDVPGISRGDMLRVLGNGVVPQQVAHGLRLLLPHAAAPPTSCEAGGAA